MLYVGEYRCVWESCVCVCDNVVPVTMRCVLKLCGRMWQCCMWQTCECERVKVCVCVWNVWVDVKLPLNVLTLHFQFSRFPFYMQGNWALCDWPSSTKLVAAFSSNQFCISGDRLSQEPDCWRDFFDYSARFSTFCLLGYFFKILVVTFYRWYSILGSI